MAILKGESDAANYLQCLLSAPRLIIGAPTKFELLLVMAHSQAEPGVADARDLLTTYGFETADWADAMTEIATDAFLRFGKGRHKAALNYGDCMAYALAKFLDAPLLFKGNDFAQTDIISAI